MICSQQAHSNSPLSPDLTPLLDIIFIVMVFLLLTANISIKSMQVSVPTTPEIGVLSQPPANVIAINILATAPYWAIEQQSYDNWDQFSQALLSQHKQQPKRPVIIAADQQAQVAHMLKLLALLQNNNINATSIIMEEER